MTHRSVRVTSLLLVKKGQQRQKKKKNVDHIIWMDYCSKQRHGSPTFCSLKSIFFFFFLRFHFFTEASRSPKSKRRKVGGGQQQEKQGKSRRPCRSQFCVFLPLPKALLGGGVCRESRTTVCHQRVVSGESERRREPGSGHEKRGKAAGAVSWRRREAAGRHICMQGSTLAH